VDKIGRGAHSVVDLIKQRKVHLIINTPFGPMGREHVKPIGTAAVAYGIPCITTMQGAQAAVSGIEVQARLSLTVKPLQAWYEGDLKATEA
jgi:carbamoyl-phosphate synthase large subunit